MFHSVPDHRSVYPPLYELQCSLPTFVLGVYHKPTNAFQWCTLWPPKARINRTPSGVPNWLTKVARSECVHRSLWVEPGTGWTMQTAPFDRCGWALRPTLSDDIWTIVQSISNKDCVPRTILKHGKRSREFVLKRQSQTSDATVDYILVESFFCEPGGILSCASSPSSRFLICKNILKILIFIKHHWYILIIIWLYHSP